MLKKTQSLTSNPKLKKIMAICMCMLVGCSMLSVFGFAADETVTTDISPADAAKQVFNTIFEQLNFTTILSVIAVALGSALGIYLGWWAIRKVTRMVIKAFSKGKISV